jgi:hypothetical protein
VERHAPTLAAALLLRGDVRNRKVVVDELLKDFTLGGSDAARCVKLAAAKLAYQTLHPDTRHGKAPKAKQPKQAESASFPFERYAAKKVGGWKERTISRWCMIGERLYDKAYRALLGTALANNLGALEKLAKIPEAGQIGVVAKFELNLEREGRDLLERLSRRPADGFKRVEDLPPLRTVDAPPSDAKEVEVAMNGVCVLHNHVIRVSASGEKLRLKFLGVVRPDSKPVVVATEEWLQTVERAAQRITNDYAPHTTLQEETIAVGSFIAELSAVTWIPPGKTASGARDTTPATPGHHMLTITCRPRVPLGDAKDIVLYVNRWDSAAAGTLPFGQGYAYDPYRTKRPVLTVTATPEERGWPIPYDWSAPIENAILAEFRRLRCLQALPPQRQRRSLYAERLAAKAIRHRARADQVALRSWRAHLVTLLGDRPAVPADAVPPFDADAPPPPAPFVIEAADADHRNSPDLPADDRQTPASAPCAPTAPVITADVDDSPESLYDCTFRRSPSEGTNYVAFTAMASDIAKAVRAIEIVKPPALSVTGVAGYVFDVTLGESGAAHGFVTAQSFSELVRATFPVLAVEAPGRFWYPVDNAGAFAYLEGEALTFHVNRLMEACGPMPDTWHDPAPKSVVSYTSTDGIHVEHKTDVDPAWLSDLGSQIDVPWTPLNTAVVRAALEIATPFTARAPNAPDHEVLQLLADHRPGILLATDGYGVVTFASAHLRGKQLVVHRTRVKPLLAFLSQRAQVTQGVEVATSSEYHFVRCEDRIFGWAADELALSALNIGAWHAVAVLSVRRNMALSVLPGPRACRAVRPGTAASTIEVVYRQGEDGVRFVDARRRTSSRLDVENYSAEIALTGVSLRVQTAAFRRLFEMFRASESVDLYIAFSKTNPESAVFRTVEEFDVEGHRCEVTRTCYGTVTALHRMTRDWVAPHQADVESHVVIPAQ